MAAGEVERFDGVEALVVERYDREWRDGSVEKRIHQEDFPPGSRRRAGRQVRGAGGPTLRRCAEVIRQWSDPEELWRLLDLSVLNIALGNADAHAKNLSLLHQRNGRVLLAPAYDLVGTLHDERISTRAGMSVNGESDITRITRDDLVEEGVSWGVPRGEIASRIDDVLARLPDALTGAAHAITPQPTVLAAIRAQGRRLGAPV